MKYILISLLLLSAQAFVPPVHAAEETQPPRQSLFFSEEESAAIRALAPSLKTARTSNGIHLGAVIYYGPENWTLWLQGQRWTPESDRPDMHIVSVEPNAVQIAYARTANEAPRSIILRPYQTYELGSGRVVEGEP